MADNKDQKKDPSEQDEKLEQAAETASTSESNDAPQAADQAPESAESDAPAADSDASVAEASDASETDGTDSGDGADDATEDASADAASEPEDEASASSETPEATASGDADSDDAATVADTPEGADVSGGADGGDGGGSGDGGAVVVTDGDSDGGDIEGLAAFFDHPDDLMQAAAAARDAQFKRFDAFSPYPIHGMDDAMGIGRSWIPWVTFGAGSGGFLLANAMQFGMLTFDWPMIIGGKPFAPWPSFVPIMFELTVLLAGVTTAVVMLFAAGCFRKPRILDPEITNDRFALWISAEDEAFDANEVRAFLEKLQPVEIRTYRKGA